MTLSHPKPAGTMPAGPHLVRTFFVAGTPPKHMLGRYAVDDPPAGGWCHVVVVPGEKRSTLLCPFTLFSWQVPNGCEEMKLARHVEAAPERIANEVTRTWELFAALGMQRDYAVAALVLTQLGAEVPKAVAQADPGSTPRVQGGKPIEAANLRPVNPDSKRGAVAKFFLGGGISPQPQSLHEAMARLGLTRSGVLSHLFCLHRDHGVGYTLVNDCATLLVPDDFLIFNWVAPERKGDLAATDDGQPRPEPKKRTSGKPVDLEALSPIPEPGKRAAVARLFIGGFHPIKDAEQKLELNRSAVLSHLFTINRENGLGYELSEDGTQARLVVPDGHEPFCAK